ncbi:MAG: sulfatase-like hydrolase/transferase, partial [Bdellovibrionaceae bacterium]|nr:sulfatase-like hydrolase/transferase [Pseudobdellovibrionaceae bacterium]
MVAVDRLSFNSYSCGEDRNNLNSGFNTLCQESIRYTNTYATSTQSAASLASLLTARYPYEHGIHRNQDRVRAELPQLQEIFKANGYRTAFFSANPNVMRRTGLARGFDLFEDSSFLNQNSYTTRLAEQTKDRKS